MSDKSTLSSSHLVLIPSYNTGKLLKDTVAEALQQWAPVWARRNCSPIFILIKQ